MHGNLRGACEKQCYRKCKKRALCKRTAGEKLENVFHKTGMTQKGAEIRFRLRRFADPKRNV